MTAGLADLTIEQGATYKATISWTDAAGVPINLTGFNAKLWITEKEGPKANIYQASDVTGQITFDAVNGKIFLNFPYTDTKLFPTDIALIYDLKLINTSTVPNEVTTLISGAIKVVPSITVVT